jgi:hypothetical protein
MARWTTWRKLAEHKLWYSEDFGWDGPACYELALAGPRRGNLLIVYVGETVNERRRLSNYGRDGSHLANIIARHLRDGWHLYYRARVAQSKKHAVQMQNNLLLRWNYDWNLKLNTWGK